MNCFDKDKILARGRATIKEEATQVLTLSESLGESFVAACSAILESDGRVILTGMGKSGIIAKKISSTLSSTGTPSYYLHPAEGIHGDMGMVAEGDIVIALSNSGESQEIINILPSIKRIGAMLIGMTGRENSTLAFHSDIFLSVKVNGEACPLGLAPTTSTTAQLAMGDAIALAVMEARHFTKDQYAVYHPGGTLGKKLLLKVSDVMRVGDSIALVNKNTSVKEVLFSITSANAGAAFVVSEDDGTLLGIITDGDLRRALLSDEKSLSFSAEKIMCKNPVIISPNKLATEALRMMETKGKQIGEMPVVVDGKPIGMICIKDLLSVGIV